MTCNVSVSDATFDAAREVSGSDRLMNEVVGTIAAYNMVTRYIVAFNLTTDEAGL
jgi:alkylhydroperoxidase family enzyme